MTDTLPAGITVTAVVCAGGGTYVGPAVPFTTTAPTPVSCNGAVVAAGVTLAVMTITFDVPANPGGATFTNTVSGTATVATISFNLGPATATVTQSSADPTLAKAFNPGYISAAGGTATVTITVTNPTGSGGNASINLTDVLPAGLTGTGTFSYAGGWAPAPTCTGTTTITCTGGSLAPGASGTITFTVNVPAVAAGAQYTNTVSGTITINGNNFSRSASATLWQGVYLVHIADDGSIITQSEVNNNVRGSATRSASSPATRPTRSASRSARSI